jgi:hypothetical protein
MFLFSVFLLDFNILIVFAVIGSLFAKIIIEELNWIEWSWIVVALPLGFRAGTEFSVWQDWQ